MAAAMFRDAGGRLALALAVSALIHAWLAGGMRLGRVQFSEVASLPIEARLESRDAPRPLPSVAPLIDGDTDSSPGLLARNHALASGSEPAAEPEALSSADTAEAMESLPDQHQYDPRPPLDAPLVVDATVYAPHELDVIPLPLTAATLPIARELAGAVSVTLELVVDEHGNVQEGQVVDVAPPDYPADAALQAFRATRFSPAERNGRAVRARIAIKIESAGSDGPRQVSP